MTSNERGAIPETPRYRWIVGAENVLATEEQLVQVLALGRRCVEAGYVTPPQWHGLVAAASKGPRTVAALREMLSTLFLYAAVRSPELGSVLREKSEQLADVLRVSM